MGSWAGKIDPKEKKEKKEPKKMSDKEWLKKEQCETAEKRSKGYSIKDKLQDKRKK